MRARFPDFAALLTATEEETAFATLRRAESIGRPIGNTDFFDRLEDLTDTTLKPARRGRKAKAVIGEN